MVQVKDWCTFWGMFQNWVWVFSVLMDNRKERGRMTSTVRDQLAWLQIEPSIIQGKIGKVCWQHPTLLIHILLRTCNSAVAGMDVPCMFSQ